MIRHAFVVPVVVASLVLAGCADDGVDDTLPDLSTTTASTAAPSSTTTAETSTTAATTSVPTTGRIVLWPATGVRFDTPQAVAADFVAQVLGEGAVLGSYREGDSRSGEIEVYASDENGRPLAALRSTLVVREEADGWVVVAAVSDGATIETPESASTVTGVVTVSGRARGFEANVNIRAVTVANPQTVLDETFTMAGNMGGLEPYQVELDLRDANPGDVVLIIVHGGVGLETDPGETAVIAVRVA
jgi:hypothetical protein